jgi:glycosyltransferase involved in cell wall biosynthesis
MKILQLIQKQQLRGAEIFASQLAEGLMKQGHEVMIVSLFEGTATLPFSGKTMCVNASTQSRLFDFRAWKKLNEIIRTFKPGVVQANAGDTLKYAVFSRLFFRWPGKIVFRNANLMSAFIRGSFHKRLNRWLLSQCDFFISVSENCRQDLARLYPPSANASVTIPIGTNNFSDVTPAIRETPRGEPVFIAIGSFVPEKNHTFVINVFNQYYRTNGKGFLWLVGDGRSRPQLEHLVSSLGLGDRVRFWGYRSDAIALLKAADVFIMPSLIEGLPAVILEAMACGVPVVTSSVGGIPEVVKNDVTGICVVEMSPDVYVQKIEALLKNEDYRAKLVDNARHEVISRFSLPKVTNDFSLQYSKLSLSDLGT